jgi:hypothetical protein
MRKIILGLLLFVIAPTVAQVHTLKESIHFGLGKTSLNHNHKKKLDSIVVLLKTSKSYLGEIKGYTCSIGSVHINKVVSNLRALNVLNYLVDRGASKINFTYSGLGTSHPIGNNKTIQGRSQNRRTDIEVVLSLFEETVSFSEEGKENAASDTKNGRLSNKVSEASMAAASLVELGPDFVSGKMNKAGNKLIKSTNGINLNLDKNSLVSGSSEPIDLDFKDYTQNYDIIKKGLNTATGGCKNLSLIGSFSASFTQEYQELSINSLNPIIVSIPSEYFPNAKLYSNPRNWTLDTINKLSYNNEKKAYEVSVINNTNMIGVFNDVPDTIVFLKVKIKGLSPEFLKPYVIYDNCNISSCCSQTKKWLFFTSTSFLVPISTKSTSYKIRSNYTDFSSKNGDTYSVNYDIKNLDLSTLTKEIGANNEIIYTYTEKINVSNQKLDKSSLCDPINSAN